MQGICLLLTGRNGLNSYDLRHSVSRIPEVSQRIKEVQSHLDDLLPSGKELDLMAHLQTSDDIFNQNYKLKSLVATTVQVGLFDRFIKFRSRPQYLVGQSNGTSALKVCCGEMDFSELVEASDFVKQQTMPPQLVLQQTALHGEPIEEFALYEWLSSGGRYQEVNVEQPDAASIIMELTSRIHLQQCVFVGPCHENRAQELSNKGIVNLPTMNSIDMDPILTSFWRSA